MIYITGDTHGFQDEWTEHIEPVLKENDIIIVAGDFGIGFWGKKDRLSEEEFFDYIASKGYTLMFTDGNHENFDKLYSYPIEMYKDGKIHRIRHNIIHLMRGEIYTIEGITLFAFGGGYSVDKYMRRENISWWHQEMPDEQEYENAEKNLRNAGNKVDYIVTHTAPDMSVYYLSTLRRLGVKNNMFEEKPLNCFLDGVCEATEYKHWYIGHFHVDIDIWKNQTVLFNTVRILKTNEIVTQWHQDNEY